MIKVTLTSGLVGKKKTQRRVVEGLGLGKFGSSVVHADSPTIRGMINKVHHLVTVTPAEVEKAASQPAAAKTTKKVSEKAAAAGPAATK
jgi:large subunit ribosomal protein L30